MAGAHHVGRELTGRWHALAPAYDLQLPLERAAVDSLVELLAPGPAERLLDVGTGTGAVLRALAALPEPPRDVLALDSSPAMLARVPALPRGWRLMEADATALPLSDGSVDVLSCVVSCSTCSERLTASAPWPRSLGCCGPAAGRAWWCPPCPAAPCGRRGRPRCRVAGEPLGLAVIDAVGELARGGLTVERGRFVRRGYPSHCLLARLEA